MTENYWITCPIEKCVTAFVVGKFPAGSRTEDEAIRLMKEHLMGHHSPRELEDLVWLWLLKNMKLGTLGEE